MHASYQALHARKWMLNKEKIPYADVLIFAENQICLIVFSACVSAYGRSLFSGAFNELKTLEPDNCKLILIDYPSSKQHIETLIEALDYYKTLPKRPKIIMVSYANTPSHEVVDIHLYKPASSDEIIIALSNLIEIEEIK